MRTWPGKERGSCRRCCVRACAPMHTQTIIVATLVSFVLVLALALNAVVLRQMQAQIPANIRNRALKRGPKNE